MPILIKSISRWQPQHGTTKAKRTKFAERGATLVEMALSLTVFCMVLFGVMDFGRMTFAFNWVSHAAHAGARYVMVRGAGLSSGRGWIVPSNVATCSDLQNFVTQQLVALDSSRVTVSACAGSSTCTPTTSCSGFPGVAGVPVKVRVQYCFQPVVPFVPTCSSTSCPNSTSTKGCTLTGTSVMYIDGYHAGSGCDGGDDCQEGN